MVVARVAGQETGEKDETVRGAEDQHERRVKIRASGMLAAGA